MKLAEAKRIPLEDLRIAVLHERLKAAGHAPSLWFLALYPHSECDHARGVCLFNGGLTI